MRVITTIIGLLFMANAWGFNYQPTETSYPIDPDETPVVWRTWEEYSIYKLMTGSHCAGLALVNEKSKHYQKLVDVSCDNINHVGFLPLSDKLVAIDFFNNDVQMARITFNK